MKTLHFSLFAIIALPLVSLALWNCGDDDEAATTGGGGSAGASVIGAAGNQTNVAGRAGATSVVLPGGAGAAGSSGGGGTPVTTGTLNGCTDADYDDLTAATATREIENKGSTAYKPACIIINEGQSVTFKVNQTEHPTEAGKKDGTLDASPNSPIADVVDGTPITFPTAGNFPYFCTIHAPMLGVIRVKKPLPASYLIRFVFLQIDQAIWVQRELGWLFCFVNLLCFIFSRISLFVYLESAYSVCDRSRCADGSAHGVASFTP